MKRLLTTAAAVIILTSCTPTTEARHTCNYSDCEKLGNPSFKSDYEPDTDGYLFDLLHYRNPDLTYEQIETVIFGEPNEPGVRYPTQ